MAKYEPLGEYLRGQDNDLVRMSFADIERVTGVALPPSATRHRPFWSNNPHNSVMTQVWLDAGFESEQVDMVRRTLAFRRVREPKVPEGVDGKPFHPLYGYMQGMIRVMPGVDVTQGSDAEWAAHSQVGADTRES